MHHGLLLWAALYAQAESKQICLPAPSGKQWVCMPPEAVEAWKAAHPAAAQALAPTRQKTAPAPAEKPTRAGDAYVPTASHSPAVKITPVRPTTVQPATIRPTPVVKRSPAADQPRSALQTLDRDAAIRLLYKAPVTLPAQGSRLRRAPTTLEELQQQRQSIRHPKPSSRRNAQAKQAGQAAPASRSSTVGQVSAKPVYHWQVRLLGSALPSKLGQLQQQLPAALQPCHILSRPLGELDWQELRCGHFRSRREAQQWAEQNRTAFPDGSLPTVVKVVQ